MNIALVSFLEQNNLPNLINNLKPVLFFSSQYKDYTTAFSDLCLQIEKEIFLQNKVIDLIFFAEHDELDSDKFFEVVKTKSRLVNSIFFTKTIENKQLRNLWTEEWRDIFTSNFFCKPEIFLYLKILRKISLSNYVSYLAENYTAFSSDANTLRYLHIFNVYNNLRVSINHIHYD